MAKKPTTTMTGDRPMVADDEVALILSDLNGEAQIASDPETAFKAMSDDDIASIVSAAVDDAIDFIASEIAEKRIKAQRYFNGEVDIGSEAGRSKIVMTKVRDTIRAVKPSIQRVFMTSARPIDFVPSGPEDVASMEQASIYAAAKFRQANGYQILRDVSHDALLKKTGFTKAYWSEYDEAKVYNFEDLDDSQYQTILSDPTAEVIQHSERPDEATIAEMRAQIEQAQQMAAQLQAQGQPVDPAALPQMPVTLPALHDIRVMRRVPRGKLCIETVPPEEFFVDRNARSDEDFYVIGHRTQMRAADVIAMGIPEDKVLDLDSGSGADMTDQEDQERRRYAKNTEDEENPLDPAMKLVTVTEAYMRIDVDGTGTPILHKVLMGGASNRLLSYEPVDDHPLAGWHVDPEPHTYFGRSLAEIVESDQDATTSIFRGIADNVHMTNNPRTEAVKGQVEMDDLLNVEIGQVVRVNAPNMVRDMAVPFVAGQTLPALQYLDQNVEVKTGVTRASMGLDPDSLQSTTRAAVTATVSAGAGQVEVMVANLAHTGMRRLFRQILKLMSQHSIKAEMLRINGTFTPMDPRVWGADLDAVVNVGLGTGREEQKNAVLGQVFGIQMQAIQSFGPDNPISSVAQMRNTLADILSVNGIHNADRYFLPVQPQPMGGAQPPQGQQAPNAPDPTQGIIQAETIKAQAKLISDSQRMQLEMAKAQMQDDRERDRMLQDMEIAMAQIAGKYGIAIDSARIKAEQAMTQPAPQPTPQGPVGSPMAPPTGPQGSGVMR